MTTLLICASLQDKGLSWSETLLAGENLYTEPSRCPGRRVTFRTSPRAKWDDILSSDWLSARHTGSWLANLVHAHADTDAGILQILIFTVMMAILSTPLKRVVSGFSVETSTLGATLTFLIHVYKCIFTTYQKIIDLKAPKFQANISYLLLDRQA